MNKLIVYSRLNCPACVSKKAFLRAEGVPFEEIILDTPEKIKKFREAFPDVKTVPFLSFMDVINTPTEKDDTNGRR